MKALAAGALAKSRLANATTIRELGRTTHTARGADWMALSADGLVVWLDTRRGALCPFGVHVEALVDVEFGPAECASILRAPDGESFDVTVGPAATDAQARLHLAVGPAAQDPGLFGAEVAANQDDFIRRVCASQPLRAASQPLLGLGSGLTPSADDFLGGVLAASIAFDGTLPLVDVDATERELSRWTSPVSAAHLACHFGGFGSLAEIELIARLREPGGELDLEVQRLFEQGHTSGRAFAAGLLAQLGLPQRIKPLVLR